MRFRLAVAVAAVAALGLAPGALAAAPKPPLIRGVVDVETNLAFDNGAAAGTGMVLTSSGEVLTNNHVIRGASTVRVVDPSTGRAYTATVLGYSVASDVAVLQLSGASHLKTVTLGSSATLKVGQKVTAVGNANGAGGRPASARGKITGLGAAITASDGQGLAERLVGLIRTDAALQPGDSGGPLLNAAGRVIGMDTAASVGFAFQSAAQGFAIPIGRALATAKQIVAGQASATVHVGSTPFLGVSVAPPAQGQGALVVGVVPGSPAEQAGLAAGDTITALDGTPISSFDDLSAAVLAHRAGDTVTLQWVDQTGATQSASVTTVTGPPQ